MIPSKASRPCRCAARARGCAVGAACAFVAAPRPPGCARPRPLPRRPPRPRAAANPPPPGVPDRGRVDTRVRRLRRDAQVPARLHALRLRQSGRAQGRHRLPGQPRPAHELRQVQSVHAEGQPADRRVDPDVRVARRSAPATSPARSTAWSPRRCWSRRTSRRSPSACTRRRASTTATRSRRPTSSTSFEMLTSKGAAPARARRARRHQGRRRCSTSARSASTSRNATDDTIFNDGQPAGVLAQVGRGAGRQAEAVRPGRSPSTRSRPARTRSRARIPAAASSSSATRTTGRATSASAAASSTSTGSSTGSTATARSSMEAFKAGEFDIIQEFVAPQYVRAARRRQVARRPDRQEGVRIRHGQGHAGVPAQPAPAALPGPPRARGARLHLRLREDQPVHERRVRSYSLFSNSDFAAKGLPGPGELALLEPFRSELPPEVFGCRTSRRAPTPAPTRCATT